MKARKPSIQKAIGISLIGISAAFGVVISYFTYSMGVVRDEYPNRYGQIPESFWSFNSLWVALLVCFLLFILGLASLFFSYRRWTVSIIGIVLCLVSIPFLLFTIFAHKAHTTRLIAHYSANASSTSLHTTNHSGMVGHRYSLYKSM